MGESDFFDHENLKDPKRKDPNDRAKLAGIQNPSVSENISYQAGFAYASYLELADSIVDAWIDSPSHRKILYSKDALQLGCGLYYKTGLWQNKYDLADQNLGIWISTQNFQSHSKVKASKAKDKGPSN